MIYHMLAAHKHAKSLLPYGVALTAVFHHFQVPMNYGIITKTPSHKDEIGTYMLGLMCYVLKDDVWVPKIPGAAPSSSTRPSSSSVPPPSTDPSLEDLDPLSFHPTGEDDSPSSASLPSSPSPAHSPSHRASSSSSPSIKDLFLSLSKQMKSLKKYVHKKMEGMHDCINELAVEVKDIKERLPPPPPAH